jgi:hypothetical protein
MRCKACNVILEDHELTKKDSNGHFFDLCSYCLSSSNILDDPNSDTLVENYHYEGFTDDEDSDTLF